jgi:hypothetical protein
MLNRVKGGIESANEANGGREIPQNQQRRLVYVAQRRRYLAELPQVLIGCALNKASIAAAIVSSRRSLPNDPSSSMPIGRPSKLNPAGRLIPGMSALLAYTTDRRICDVVADVGLAAVGVARIGYDRHSDLLFHPERVP